MKKNLSFLLFSVLFLTTFSEGFSQGANCNSADPFCTGTTYTFPNSTNNGDLGAVDCLGSSPNPAWYYMEIDQNGSMTFNISQVDGGGNGIDVDFIIWGPYSSLSAACATSLMTTSGVDCSYSTAAVETATIPSASVGQVYVLLLTNYSNVPGTITFSQTGGAGSADCSIICGVQSFTANPTACNSGTNTYDVSGSLVITSPPGSGTLTISSSCGGSQVFNAPFTSPINYSLTGLTANGSSCTVSATFSADATCNTSATYTAPPACTLSCSIQSLTATPGACVPATNTYDVSGAVTFTNAPASGTLTVSNSCGGSQVFNAPFVSPANYNLTGLTANGSSCTITAVFSADPACTANSNYTAPANCSPICNISSVTASVGTINCANQTYDANGQITFSNAPSSGSLTVSSSCGGSQTFFAPFTSPQAYTLGGQPANGGSCTITAVFSADPACTNTATITNPAMPTASASNDGPVCENGTINLSSPTVTGATYSWTGPGGYTSSQQNPTISPISVSGSGTYTVTVTLNGCTATATTNVTVNPNPVVTAGSDVTVCEGDTINLSASTVNGATYSWTGPNGFTSSQQNPVINPAATGDAGTYTVVVTLNGCTSTPDNMVVTVNPVPVVNATSNSPLCEGDALQLNANTINGATYVWTGPNGFTSTSQNPLIDPVTTADAGNYTVVATLNGCTSAPDVVAVTVSDVNAGFTASPSSGVSPLNVTFTNTTTGGTAYSWDYGNGFTENTTSTTTSQTYITDSTYTVTMIAVNADGCSDTATVLINVVPNFFIIIPNVFSPNGDGVNDVFELDLAGVNTLHVEIYDRWGLFMYGYDTLTGSWNGEKDGKEASEGVYYYIIQLMDSQNTEHKYTGHITLTR